MQSHETTSSTAKRPPFSLATTISAIHSELRWRMLARLANEGPCMVSELAADARCSPNAASRHLTALKAKGILTLRKRLYQLSDRLGRPAPGQVDFGYFVADFTVKG